ncbi:MAG TPA: hypothetical protein VK186_13275 [Candidatus Deferrimicrobium sp.]|nr:hypothetical protein [Candidatus Deferrimicrobium sp.]
MKKTFLTFSLILVWVLFQTSFHSPLFLTAQQGNLTIQELKQRVAALCKLDFKTDIPIKYLNKDRLKKYIGARVDQEYPGELVEKEEMYFQLLGFSDQPINVKNLHKKILIANAGAYYNEKTKEFFALKGYQSLNMMNAMVVAHELRHALLDAHFDLTGLLGKYPDYDDRGLAVICAIEGDAVFTTLLCNGFNPELMASTDNAAPLFSFSPMGNTAQLYKSPDVVKNRFMMPNIDGLRFLIAVFSKKKWQGINDIWSSPPDSSEQILHPEKYLKREKPIAVAIEYIPDGYELYHSGVIGEYYLNVLLMPTHASKYFAFANGWGGDAFNIYRKSSSHFLIWKSTWDEEKFCASFSFLFKRFIENKFQANFKEGNIKGSAFVAGQSGDNYFFIRRIRNEMIYIRTNDRNQMNKFIYGGNYD